MSTEKTGEPRRKLLLRSGTLADTTALVEAYEQIGSHFIVARPFADLEQACELGRFILGEVNGKIVTAAGIFDYGTDDYVELGDTFVDSAFWGLGLQRILLRLRIANVVLNQSSKTSITVGVDPSNAVSLNNVLSVGFTSWESPIDEVFATCGECKNRVEDRRCCCNYYIMPATDAAPALMDLLRDTAQGVQSIKDVDIEYTLRSVRGESRDALQRFIDGERWD